MDVLKASSADIPQLVQLRLAYLTEVFGSLSVSDVSEIRSRLPGWLEKHLNNDLFVFTVREEDVIVSCAFLLVIEKPMSPSFINGKTGTVLNVYTCPEYRRRGYGKAVMTALVKEAEEMELCSVDLKATEDGYSLYKAVGFTDDTSKYHNMKMRLR